MKNLQAVNVMGLRILRINATILCPCREITAEDSRSQSDKKTSFRRSQFVQSRKV